MKNYAEKEKKLEGIIKKLNTMSDRVIKMNNDIDSLNLEKNQLLREKQESDKNFGILSKQHEELKFELEKIDKDVSVKFGKKDHFNKKIDELNQETEILIDEIDKWQT
jgi:5-formyltetrahydrofolate cyclo-ligase|tara:strand:+ start:231 stop:554 length:324 start_codon:yes stop_codon:yes gene_type:complete